MPKNTPKSLTLYMTLGCHLCDEALSIVQQAAQATGQLVQIEEKDIALDDVLYEQYFDKIPVLQGTDGQQLFYPFERQAVANWLNSV